MNFGTIFEIGKVHSRAKHGAISMAKVKITNDKNKTNPAMDLVAIRSGFDGVTKHVNSLPEGKQKTNILNAIEDAYFSTASAFKGFLVQSVANA